MLCLFVTYVFFSLFLSFFVSFFVGARVVFMIFFPHQALFIPPPPGGGYFPIYRPLLWSQTFSKRLGKKRKQVFYKCCSGLTVSPISGCGFFASPKKVKIVAPYYTVSTYNGLSLTLSSPCVACPFWGGRGGHGWAVFSFYAADIYLFLHQDGVHHWAYSGIRGWKQGNISTHWTCCLNEFKKINQSITAYRTWVRYGSLLMVYICLCYHQYRML